MLFTGDFNFDPSWEEEEKNVDPTEYENVWESLRGKEGIAFTKYATPEKTARFLDRILMKNGGEFEASYIERVGM